MSSFVYDNLAVPDGKVNLRNLVGDPNNYITDAEWNLVMQYMEDIRTAIVDGDFIALRNYAAAVSSAGSARIRLNGNALEASVNGRAYGPLDQAKGHYTAAGIGVLTSNTAAQNSDAIEAWIAILPDSIGATLTFGATNVNTSEFYDFARTINLSKPIRLRGAGPGSRSVLTSYLRWPANTTGIRIKYLDGGSTIGRGSSVEDLALVGLGYGGATSGHGIFIEARGIVRNVWITNFGGNGVSIEASTGDSPATNANNWFLENVGSVQNKGHGFYVNGADANAGVAICCDGSSNVGWGFFEESFLGNTYMGCHADANILGSYYCEDPNNRSVYVGCYHEGGQPLPDLSDSNALWLGGLVEGGAIPGGTALQDGRWTALDVRAAGNGQTSIENHVQLGSRSSEGNQSYIRWWHATKGSLNQRMDIGGEPFWEMHSPDTVTSGLRVAGKDAVINTRAAFGAAHQFPAASGFFNGDLRFDSSTIDPATSYSGTYYRTWRPGDTRYKKAPTSGDTGAWICITAGTSGTYTEGRTVTSSGLAACTLNAASAATLNVGDKVTVNGVTTTITALSGTSITFADAIPAGSGLAIVYSPPVFAELTLTGNGADSTASPGNATQNVSSGRVAIAAGANSVTVTCSKCTATSRVYPVLQTIDGTLTAILACVPSSGSFTIYGNANATGAVNVGWEIR